MRNDAGRSADTWATSTPRPSYDDPWPFEVLETGRIVADWETAINTAESVLYIARIADAVGYRLGAGPLRAVEVFGRGNAYAVVGDGSDPTVRGCVARAGSSPEELRAWLSARSML